MAKPGRAMALAVCGVRSVQGRCQEDLIWKRCSRLLAGKASASPFMAAQAKLESRIEA